MLYHEPSPFCPNYTLPKTIVTGGTKPAICGFNIALNSAGQMGIE